MSRAAACLCLLSLAAAAQDGGMQVPLQRVQPVDWTRSESKLHVEQFEGRIRRVSWDVPEGPGGQVVIPLANPVLDLEAALLPQNRALVLLAGGVREGESLDLYVADRRGRVYSFESQGGGRLPPDFADGLGSWPVFDGLDVLLFAFRRQGRIWFNAIGLSWSDPAASEKPPLLARREMAATGSHGEAVTGFTAVSDLASNQVRVTFAGGADKVEFAHPMAPRPELQPTLVDFGRQHLGRTSERQVEVRNTGKRTLHLQLKTHAPFELVGPGERDVAPGDKADIGVRFAPEAAGTAQERLQVLSNSSLPNLAVRLHGDGVDPAAPPAVAPAPAAVAEATPPPAPPPAPPATAPAVLGCSSVRVEPQPGARVRVTGIANVAGPGIELRLGSGSGGEAQVGADAMGAFAAELSAVAGDLLTAMAVGEDGSRSQLVELGRVLPWLQRDGDDLVLHGAPGRPFVLFAVAAAADGRVAAGADSWRGQLDAQGRRRLALAAFAPAAPPAVVAVVDPGGRPRRSNVLALR